METTRVERKKEEKKKKNTNETFFSQQSRRGSERPEWALGPIGGGGAGALLVLNNVFNLYTPAS